jgi:hypothetical protein
MKLERKKCVESSSGITVLPMFKENPSIVQKLLEETCEYYTDYLFFPHKIRKISRLWSFGVSHRVVSRVNTIVSKKHATSTVKVYCSHISCS